MNARAVGLVVALALAPAATADVVRFRFDGVVVTNTFTAGPWASPDPGDAFGVAFSFDTSALDADASPSRGDYADCMLDFAIIVGSGFELGNSGAIVVTDTDVGDGYESRLNLVGGLIASFRLADPTGTAIGSDALPSNLNFDTWTSRVFQLSGTAGEIAGTITSFSVVPAPSGAAILGAGLIFAGRRRRL